MYIFASNMNVMLEYVGEFFPWRRFMNIPMIQSNQNETLEDIEYIGRPQCAFCQIVLIEG